MPEPTTRQHTLDSYTLAGSERHIITRRTRHATQLIDRPARGRGPRFLIENDVSGLPGEELRGLIDDYVTHAQSLGRPPFLRAIGQEPPANTPRLSRDLIDDADQEAPRATIDF